MSPSCRLPAILAIALALSVLSVPPTASAGAYDVRQCDYAAGIGQHDFVWQGAGNPAIVPYPGSGCGEFGLATRNGAPGASQTYPAGGYGGWFAYAPPGTVFTRFSGSFGVLAGCCINGLASYAEATERPDGGGTRAYLFQGNLGNNSWYPPSGLQGPVGREWSAAASGAVARRVGFHLRCGPGFSCPQQTTGDLRLRGRSFGFTLRDDVAPTVGPPGGTLLSGGWRRGTQTLGVTAGDLGGGLTRVSAEVDDGTSLQSPSACATAGGRYVRLQPCPLARGVTWSVNTAQLPDGTRTATVRASDAGGATATRTVAFRVDNTAPGAPRETTVTGGGSWRRTNGFVVRWANPGGQHAPIVAAGWRACRSGDGCVTGQRTGVGVTDSGPIALPGAGEWDVRLWLEDAAGNANPTAASLPLRLRYDPDPPLLRFASPDLAAPTRVAVHVTDRSGIAAAAIELRRYDRGPWRPLPTVRYGRQLLATVNDAGLARGGYELRARATDLAGNEAVAAGPTLTLPLRRPSRLRMTARRRIVRHGSKVVLHGRLTTASGNPLAGRVVGVMLSSRGRAARHRQVRSSAAGRLALTLRARRSVAVGLRFAGDDHALPSSGRVVLRVPAPATMTASRRLIVGDRAVRFGGRVRGGAIPRRGKLVEVQAHFRGRWRTISTVRTNRSGRWRFRYAFRSAGAIASYRMRVRVPGEAGYPFAPGASRPVRVTVLGR